MQATYRIEVQKQGRELEIVRQSYSSIAAAIRSIARDGDFRRQGAQREVVTIRIERIA